MNPKVSVLLSVYNGEHFISESVGSILSQTMTDFEFIIINDGSIDDSFLKLKNLDDPRIIIFNNQHNLGLTRSLNIGLKFCRGDYIARMDVDDISHPDRLEKQVKLLDTHKEVGVCGTFVECFDRVCGNPLKPVTSDEIKAALLFENPITHSSVMIRKDLLLTYNIEYDESFSCSQDYELWSRLFPLCYFYNIPETLLKYRYHEKQISSHSFHLQQESARRVLINIFNRLKINPDPYTIYLHEQLFYGKYLNYKEESDLVQWLIKLIEHNTITKTFNETIFASTVLTYFFRWESSLKSDFKENKGDINIDLKQRFKNFLSFLQKPKL